MAGKRTIDIGNDTELSLWGIFEFMGVMLLGALATGFLLTAF